MQEPPASPYPLTIDTLPGRVRACSDAATASGALVTLPTRVHGINDAGIGFAVRVSGNVARREAAGRSRDPDRDPFAPPHEPDLLVGELSPTHVALLNKYNVLPGHLLLVTRADRPQTELLDSDDFEAALIALAAFDGLVFYNGGPEAGASQPHKHLQLVPLPLAPGHEPVPFAPVLREAVLTDGIGYCPGLPFRHAVAPVAADWWQAPLDHAAAALAVWQRLWRALDREVAAGGTQPVAYNLLLSREWMWLVPRRCGAWEGIGVNALGYAGALLVADETRHERLRQVGPLRLLRATAAT